jgi:uncharacterized coiled-coil DUF342 family protein
LESELKAKEDVITELRNVIKWKDEQFANLKKSKDRLKKELDKYKAEYMILGESMDRSKNEDGARPSKPSIKIQFHH